MVLSFRQRIFVVLVALTAVPTTLVVIGWAVSLRQAGPAAGASASFDQVVASTRALLQRVDTTRLSPSARAAVRSHLEQLANSVNLARRADTYQRYYAAGFTIIVLLLGAMVVFAS